MEKVDVLLNPVRMRIIQYAAHNHPVTVGQIAGAMPDVSKATLYRHMRVLTENGILQIAGEEKIRGTVEVSYSLNVDKINASGQESYSELQALIYSMLTKVIADFAHYFSKENINPFDDGYFVSANALSLKDSDFDSFKKEVFAVVEKYSLMPAVDNSKMRMITVVSSPAASEETEE